MSCSVCSVDAAVPVAQPGPSGTHAATVVLTSETWAQCMRIDPLVNGEEQDHDDFGWVRSRLSHEPCRRRALPADPTRRPWTAPPKVAFPRCVCRIRTYGSAPPCCPEARPLSERACRCDAFGLGTVAELPSRH